MPVGYSNIDMVGEKVRLRPVVATDASAAYRLVKNDAVLVTMAWDEPADERELHDTYARCEEEIKSGENYYLAIERTDQTGLMGNISIRFPRHPQQADIGYWLGEPFWNQGYMTEAVRLVCHFSFKYLDAVRVYATVFVGNIGSQRTLEKNGFSLDGSLRCHVYKRGEWMDGWFFTLLRSEWEHNREQYLPGHEDIVAVAQE